MSILRQLLLSVTVAIVVILLGTLGFSIQAARDYLSSQLQVQATDAAVSLSLSLSQPANNDPVVQELLVSALFDGGHFALVRLDKSDGETLVERSANRTADVPNWFRRAFGFEPVQAEHVVSDGWQQLGEVTLIPADSYALESLWRSSRSMTLLVLAAGALWALFAIALVRWIERRLLGELSEQVRSIGEGPVPAPFEARVPELQGVTDALNHTRERVQATTEEQSATIEMLTLELNLDVVTGLPNRKYFVNEFRRLLEREHKGGHVLVFRQRDLADLNRQMPRVFIDQWLQATVNRVRQRLTDIGLEQALLARLNGSDFAVLMVDCAAPQAELLADHVRADLKAARIPVGEGHLCRWVMALSDYQGDKQIGPILARLDFALMQAESAGSDQVVSAGQFLDTPLSETGEQAWRALIRNALDADRFALAMDELLDVKGLPVRTEAMLMLLESATSEPIPATLFIPPAVRLDLSAECDIAAIRLGLDWLERHVGELVIRVALPSLKRQRFFEQLALLLMQRRDVAGRLFIEIDAYGLVEAPEQIQVLDGLAQEFGVQLGVRRLAQQFAALAQLHTVRVRYVKLGGGFVGGMLQSPGSQQLAASVLEVAQELAIEVYAEDVPDAVTAKILVELGVSAMRGPGVTF